MAIAGAGWAGGDFEPKGAGYTELFDTAGDGNSRGSSAYWPDLAAGTLDMTWSTGQCNHTAWAGVVVNPG